MKAAVIDAPNAKVRIEKRDRRSPARDQVLIRVHACGVCHGDLMLQLGQFPFARYPLVPGHEITGVIEEVGKDVDKLRKGDGLGYRNFLRPYNRPNQMMKPTAPLRCNFSEVAAAPCGGLSLSR